MVQFAARFHQLLNENGLEILRIHTDVELMSEWFQSAMAMAVQIY
jgi:hypothetical protein